MLPATHGAQRSACTLWLALLLMARSAAAQNVTFKQYEQGLPDFDAQAPFTGLSRGRAEALQQRVSQAMAQVQTCPRVFRGVSGPADVQICRPQDVAAIRSLMDRLAPTLQGQPMRFWATDLDRDGKRELLAVHTVRSPVGDTYAYVWLVRLSPRAFGVSYAGPYLEGDLHAIADFGPRGSRRVVVSFYSCTECRPWIYLSVLDFSAGPKARPFEFTYSSDQDSWGDAIEYFLPGGGHSPDGVVETRIAASSETGPHLLQRFDLVDDQGGVSTEWWVFTCRDYRCGYQMYDTTLPSRYLPLWTRALSLGRTCGVDLPVALEKTCSR